MIRFAHSFKKKIEFLDPVTRLRRAQSSRIQNPASGMFNLIVYIIPKKPWPNRTEFMQIDITCSDHTFLIEECIAADVLIRFHIFMKQT